MAVCLLGRAIKDNNKDHGNHQEPPFNHKDISHNLNFKYPLPHLKIVVEECLINLPSHNCHIKIAIVVFRILRRAINGNYQELPYNHHHNNNFKYPLPCLKIMVKE